MANEARYLYGFVAKDVITQANNHANAELRRALKTFAQTFTNAVERSQKTRIQGYYNEAAQEATRSAARAYQRRVYRTRSSSEGVPYRNEWRYSGGKLLTALNSPQMYQVTATGIKFINKQWLDQQAAQWYRLNFGAGARGARTPPGHRYRMRIFGQTLPGDFGLYNLGPSAGFQLPSGYWSSKYPQKLPVRWDGARRGQDFFIMGAPEGPVQGQSTSQRGEYLGQVLRRRPTGSLGIQGSRFLDVGVGRLVQLFPVVIEKLLTDWFSEARRAGTGPVFKNSIQPSGRSINEASRVLNSLAAQRQQNIRVRGFYNRL